MAKTIKKTQFANVLHLNVTAKWFDMVLEGIKKEEYREIKPYWCQRLFKNTFYKNGDIELIKKISQDPANKIETVFKDFDTIMYKNGYGKHARYASIEFKGIEIKEPVGEWSDNWKGLTFAIKLGEISYTNILG